MTNEEKDKKKNKKTKTEKALEKEQLRNAKKSYRGMKRNYKARTSLPLYKTEYN